MRGNGIRWMGVVDKWELGGDVPPGMGEPGPEKDSDYTKCFLRPEVRRFYLFS